MDLAIPAIAVAVGLALARNKPKKKKKSSTTDGSTDGSTYDEGSRTGPKTKPKGQPDDGSGDGSGGTDLNPANYDDYYYDPECGPGWVLVDDECLWPSAYDAPVVPRNGCWISPDCGVTIVGADFWEEVIIPQIEEWVDAGYGKSFTSFDDPSVDDWENTSGRVAYEILKPYDLGPVNPDTGKRDTGIGCLDFFPHYSPKFAWFQEHPAPVYPNAEDYWAGNVFDSEAYDWAVFNYHQEHDAWMLAGIQYWDQLLEEMPALALLFTDIVESVETYYYQVWEE